MKRKLTFGQSSVLFIFGLLIILTTIVACRKTIYDGVPETHINKTHNQYLIDYQSSSKDSILHFELEISKTGKLTDIINEDIDVDLKGNKYLHNIYETLQKRSLDNKYSDITLQQAREICISLREVIAESTKSLTPEQLKKPNIQGLYMSLAFARRILKNKLGKSPIEIKNIAKKMSLGTMNTPVEPVLNEQPSYAQDVFGGYELGLSAFAMNEDIIVNKQAFLNIVNQDALASVQDDQGLYVFQAVLNNMSASSFSLKDLLIEMDFYVSQHPENLGSGSGCSRGWWPSGHSHGCCGNYNGCCWYWNPICYVHDKICSKCKPAWFCFSGCVPDSPSSAGSGEPFGFIEDTIPGSGVSLTAVDLDSYLLPTPVPVAIQFYSTASAIPINDPNTNALTTIVQNPLDNKYYLDNSFTSFVPNGYYKFDYNSNGTFYYIYYHLVNGESIMAYTLN